MPKFKVLSGKDLINIFLKYFSFCIKSQKGSHVKLLRYYDGQKQILVIPLHKEIDRGTLKAIYKQSLAYIKAEEMDKYFCA
jgi:predicted RNA binding protein YcfA (HicA-like mRNA interferase family)